MAVSKEHTRDYCPTVREQIWVETDEIRCPSCGIFLPITSDETVRVTVTTPSDEDRQKEALVFGAFVSLVIGGPFVYFVILQRDLDTWDDVAVAALVWAIVAGGIAAVRYGMGGAKGT